MLVGDAQLASPTERNRIVDEFGHHLGRTLHQQQIPDFSFGLRSRACGWRPSRDTAD
jgi:hypothetical protein